MTMHLAHPMLSTTGHRKGPQKYASAEHKRQQQELAAAWEQKQREFKSMSTPSKPGAYQPKIASLMPKYPPGREPKQRIPSLDLQHRGAVTSPEPQVYTGDKVMGISIVHKSCLQPVFSEEQARDFAGMRR
jgi:hypothetical protein